MNWYYGINEKQFGPVDIAELKNLRAQGTLGPRDLVWNPSFGEKWVEAQTVSELAFTPSPPPATTMAVSAEAIPALVPENLGPMGYVENREITRRARASLSGKWGIAIGVVVVFYLILMVILIPLLGVFIYFLIMAPMLIGLCHVHLNLARGLTTEVGQLFKGFNSFGNGLGVSIMTYIFTLLWALLLYIPGVIAAFSYSMVYFILADNPGMPVMDTIRTSKEMMRGYKWQFFCLNLRFIGWALLSVLTLYIGLLWLVPYVYTSYAHFYEMVRRNYNAGTQVR